MIAHRLETIKSADNLLFLESPNNVVDAKKGTAQYDEVFDRLTKTNYAHQNDEADEDAKEEVAEEKKKRSLLKLKSEELRKGLNKVDSDRRSWLQDGQDLVHMDGYDQKFVSPNSGWARLGSYYKPYWVLIPMTLVALLNSIKMVPLAAFMLALLYIYT